MTEPRPSDSEREIAGRGPFGLDLATWSDERLIVLWKAVVRELGRRGWWLTWLRGIDG